MAARVVIELTTGQPRTDLDCEDCSAPSRVEVDVLWLHPDGVQVVGVATACFGCHSHSVSWPQESPR